MEFSLGHVGLVGVLQLYQHILSILVEYLDPLYVSIIAEKVE